MREQRPDQPFWDDPIPWFFNRTPREIIGITLCAVVMVFLLWPYAISDHVIP